ncbi:MAG: protein-L-isoaspartate O-methyltransferase family protein [Pseudochelatococcus sp.]|jgi:protein-L-isoaspartate(D-aspartate) O-methyltransferase|uniref:protein-L-isoaspartate O-methyltransferase family protein n=1 Tax=Pseudochelatococcus sp. TaxID=2020869 RepID=UPI003D8E8977
MSAGDFQQPDRAAEETVAFLLALRERGIRDTALLRAMEMAPRPLFAPRRLGDLARADISLPLSCGQTMTAPRIIATMVAALKVLPEHRVFEVGTGSGYQSAVLGRLAAQVVSVERYRTLALAAAERLATIGLSQVLVLPGDGLSAETVAGQRFDRIMLNGSVAGEIPVSLLARLDPGGLLVGAQMHGGEPQLVRVTRQETEEGEPAFVREILGTIRLPPLAHGVARVL